MEGVLSVVEESDYIAFDVAICNNAFANNFANICAIVRTQMLQLEALPSAVCAACVICSFANFYNILAMMQLSFAPEGIVLESSALGLLFYLPVRAVDSSSTCRSGRGGKKYIGGETKTIYTNH